MEDKNIDHSNAPFEKVELQDLNKPTNSIPVPEAIKNPLLDAIQLPGRVFKIPSGGHYYTNGELAPSVKNGELHVRPLSALAEIKLKNPDMLFSGKAIHEIFLECIPDILKPDDILGRDIDALMIFLRMVTYGNTYSVDSLHGCQDSKQHTYDIDLNNVMNDIKELDPTALDKMYTVVLENRQKVVLNPVKFRDVVKIMHSDEDQTPSETEIQENMVERLVELINSVEDITDKSMIKEWLSKIRTTDVNKIVQQIEQGNDWGPSFIRTVKCPDCNEDFEIELPVNPLNFFTE